MAANFENFLISPDFPINFSKSHQISKNYLKSSESYRQKPLGGPPGLNRVKHYKLDPVHFYTSPGLAWKACLKCTGIKLELLTDPDMLLMFERGIRGGITQAVRKYASANNKYMGDRFEPKSESSYL